LHSISNIMQKETYTCLLVTFFLYIAGVITAIIAWNDKITPTVGYYMIAGVGGWLLLLLVFDQCLRCKRVRQAQMVVMEDPPYNSIGSV
jgi:hypothetical protein